MVSGKRPRTKVVGEPRNQLARGSWFCCCVGLCPAVGLLALFVDEIDWAGIVYRKGGGRIVGIQHPGKRALATSPSERKLAQ